MSKVGLFIKSTSGASLVEYAVALIVVTIIGGSAVIGIGQNTGGLSDNASAVVASASSAAG